MLVLKSLLVGSFICLIAFYFSFRWKRRRLYELADKIPGPKGLPFIGIAYKFLTANSKVIFRTLAEVTEEFTSTVKVWLGPELLILADSPEALQVVLNSPHCLDKSSFYDGFLLNKGLVLSNGSLWKNHRKILNPAFSVSAIQQLIPKFQEKSKIFVNNLKAKVDKEPFDVLIYMAACSLETILAGALELEKDIQSDPHNNRYIQTAEVGSHMMMKKMINIFHRFKPYHWLTDVYRFEKKHIYGFFLKIADEVLDAKRLKEEIAPKDDGDFSWKPRNFISTLTDPNNGLTHEEMWHEINTLVAAGYETSALAVSHALLLLALHPEVQEKVVQEINEVCGDLQTEDKNKLNKLVYLDYVVRETMRLFPVLPLSARQSTGEFQIGEYTIPSGATILMSTYLTHRNPKYWGEDAHKFRPERFKPENFKKIHPYAFIPFSGGPRICIGMRYGMAFVKTVLINVLREFKISSELKYEELEYEITVSMKVLQRCMITLKNRRTN